MFQPQITQYLFPWTTKLESLQLQGQMPEEDYSCYYPVKCIAGYNSLRKINDSAFPSF